MFVLILSNFKYQYPIGILDSNAALRNLNKVQKYMSLAQYTLIHSNYGNLFRQ